MTVPGGLRHAVSQPGHRPVQHVPQRSNRPTAASDRRGADEGIDLIPATMRKIWGVRSYCATPLFRLQFYRSRDRQSSFTNPQTIWRLKFFTPKGTKRVRCRRAHLGFVPFGGKFLGTGRCRSRFETNLTVAARNFPSTLDNDTIHMYTMLGEQSSRCSGIEKGD